MRESMGMYENGQWPRHESELHAARRRPVLNASWGRSSQIGDAQRVSIFYMLSHSHREGVLRGKIQICDSSYGKFWLYGLSYELSRFNYNLLTRNKMQYIMIKLR